MGSYAGSVDAAGAGAVGTAEVDAVTPLSSSPVRSMIAAWLPRAVLADATLDIFARFVFVRYVNYIR